jgi:hypothetical protein
VPVDHVQAGDKAGPGPRSSPGWAGRSSRGHRGAGARA